MIQVLVIITMLVMIIITNDYKIILEIFMLILIKVTLKLMIAENLFYAVQHPIKHI